MDHPLIDLINQKIAAAEAEGEFDNLQGAGRPLPKVDDPENALLNRLVRESGGVPAFVLLHRQIEELRATLRETSDRDLRRDLLKQISMLEAQIAMERQPKP